MHIPDETFSNLKIKENIQSEIATTKNIQP